MGNKNIKKNTKPASSGIKELRKKLDKKYELINKLSSESEVAQFRNSKIRAKAASKQYNKIFEAGIKALGLDKEKLALVHLKDTKASETFHKENLQKLKTVYSEQKKITRDKGYAVRKMQKYLTGASSEQNPSIICMWIADEVYEEKVFTYEDGYFFLNQCPAPAIGVNKLSCQVGVKGNGIVQYNIIHDFSWMANRTGLLNATGEMSILGVYDMRACGNCGIGTGQIAAFNIGYMFSISQIQNGSLVEFSTPWYLVNSAEVSAGCSTSQKSGLIQLRNADFSNTTPFPVQSGSMVNFRVTTQLFGDTLWLSGDPDPYSDMNFDEINVVAIIATVQ